MSENPGADRFDYRSNLARAGSYRSYRSAFWPPADSYQISFMDLSGHLPDVGDGLPPALAELASVIDAEWRRVKEIGVPARRRFNEAGAIARAARRVCELLPGEADRHALSLRADAVEHGYTDDILQELAGLAERYTVVVGQVSTWYGKEVMGLPTAFGCVRDDQRQADVDRALALRAEVAAYLYRLHAHLRLGDLPSFGAANLFFMAGEGNLHPKHIAYFLPEDEGVKYSPFKKTYYFDNTHQQLLRAVSGPLADRFLRIDRAFDPADGRSVAIPTLGVLSHELGHFVHRDGTRFQDLNAADRWASVVLQEVAADVFGVLILADVWAPRMGLDPAEVVAYYLSECLRYTDRGLGHFPDSDGMFLQLSYFVQLGALHLKTEERTVLTGDHQVVLAGLRSLARVLADALLGGEAEPAVALHRAYGPANAAPLAPLVDQLRLLPAQSVEYVQEHIHAAGLDGG